MADGKPRVTIIRSTREALLAAAWRFPLSRVVSSRQPFVALYHGVPRTATGELDAAAFEEHIRLLKREFDPVGPTEYGHTRRRLDRIQVILTFDDGFRNNLTVVAPILRQHRVPALFFVSSRHARSGKYLWFAYLRALAQHFPGKNLSFRGRVLDMSADIREATIRTLWNELVTMRPHPRAMYEVLDNELPRLSEFISTETIDDNYAGLSAEEVAELAADPLFSIGVHTVDHPYLTRCEAPEARRQIVENREWIEQVTNRPCSTIAYPLGDYDESIVRLCEELRFEAGFAVERRPPGPEDHGARPLEVPRLGVYRPSLNVLGFKVQWGNHLRRTNAQVG